MEWLLSKHVIFQRRAEVEKLLKAYKNCLENKGCLVITREDGIEDLQDLMDTLDAEECLVKRISDDEFELSFAGCDLTIISGWIKDLEEELK